MKKIITSIQILVTVFLLHAENKFENFFNFGLYKYAEHSIDEHGWLEHDRLKNTSFSECMVIRIEKLKEISYMLYYPIGSNGIDLKAGMFEINNQKFIIHDIRFNSFGIKILSLSFENKKYLFFLGNTGKYGNRVCFIFDITNPENIIFYPPEDKFVEADFQNNFFGIYQNKLCFFFSRRRFDWNGQYSLVPYYIDEDSLKPLCDEKGNPYFVNYAYKDRHKNELMLEDKYIPKK